MEEILNNARLLELYQLYFLAINKVVSDLQIKNISAYLQKLDSSELLELETELVSSLRVFMNNSKLKLEEIVQKYNLPSLLNTIQTKAFEKEIMEDPRLEKEGLDIAKRLLSGQNLFNSKKNVARMKEALRKDLETLKQKNAELESEKAQVFEEVLQLRLNLITRVNL
jgi:hypothetical protein